MPYLLPETYHFSHEYCFFLHDLMVWMVKEGEQKRHFDVKLNPSSEETKVLQKFHGNELYEWLKENGYQKEADLLTYKQIFVATLADFLQFIFNALRSSEKGHLSVTFSLLRKPLKENLFILESLLSEPKEFLQKFNSSVSYNEAAIDKQNEETKRRIITDVLKKIPLSLMEPDFLYNLRYSKREIHSLERLWQKATHIVTSCQHYQTESGNLNFVFSDINAKKEQWRYLYFILPQMLFYVFQVCLTIYEQVITSEVIFSDESWDRALVGNMISMCNLMQDDEMECIQDQLLDIKLKCQICGKEVSLTQSMQKQIQFEGAYTCVEGHRNEFFELP